MDADLEIGRSTPLIGELEALIAEHPLRERLRGQLILALYRDGRQAEALEVYRETRRLLADELGLEPSPALRELERAILRQDPALVAASRASLIQDNFPGRRRWIVYAGLAAAALLIAGAIAAGVLIAQPESVQRVVSVLTNGQTTLATANGPHHRARGNAGKTRSDATATKSLAARSAVTHRRHSLPTGKNNVQSASASSGPSHTLPQSRTQNHSTTKSASLPRHMSRFVDSFSGSAYNARFWGGPDTLGTDVDVAQRNGELEIALHADSTPDPVYNGIIGRYWGTCNFTGDFDARIDFRLVDWPTENRARLGLLLALTGNNYVEVVRESPVSGQESYSFESPITPPHVVSTSDTSGAFRVTRIGSVITGYYRSGRHWVKLGSTVWEGYVKFLTDLSASGTTFPHKDVTTAFDNFTVFAPRSETCFGYPA